MALKYKSWYTSQESACSMKSWCHCRVMWLLLWRSVSWMGNCPNLLTVLNPLRHVLFLFCFFFAYSQASFQFAYFVTMLGMLACLHLFCNLGWEMKESCSVAQCGCDSVKWRYADRRGCSRDINSAAVGAASAVSTRWDAQPPKRSGYRSWIESMLTRSSESCNHVEMSVTVCSEVSRGSFNSDH